MNSNSKNYIQKAFDITKENMILAQPLVIYMIVISFTFASLAMQTNKIMHLVLLIANILLCTAFLAGWFSMIKQGLLLDKRVENGEFQKPEDRAMASWNLGKAFFPGVGDNFLNITATTLCYFVLFFALIYLFYKLGLQVLPNPNIDWNKLYTTANSSPAELQKFIYALNFEQLKAINLWMLYVGAIGSLFTYVTLFVFPAVFDSESDKKDFFLLSPFKSFTRNIIFIFKHFVGTMGIFIFLFFLNSLLSVLSLIFNLNIILSIIGLIISFYFITYAVILIFLYYEENK